MGCNCGGKSGNSSNYEVTRSDGTKVTVRTIGDAQAIVARSGGSFKAVPAK